MTPFGGEGHLAACHFPLEIPVGAQVSATARAGSD